MMLKKRWIMLCPNQISFNVANFLLQSRVSTSLVLVIYNRKRCQAYPFFKRGVFYCDQDWKRWVRVLVFFFQLFGGFELFAPHRKFYSFLVRLFPIAAKVSLLDDGLDTLREVSQNIAAGEFAGGTDFYALNYASFSLGEWLRPFNTHFTANVCSLGDHSLSAMDFSVYKTIVVESPPLSAVESCLRLHESSTLLIQHSNVNKRVITAFSCPVINGIDVSLEKSLRTFSGDVLVGESMVAVFAALDVQPRYRVTVYLDQARFGLLRPMLEVLKKADWIQVHFC